MIRVLLAHEPVEKSGHEAEGAGRVLRDAGHEVIYMGAAPTSAGVVETAIQEDADAIVVLTGSPATDELAGLLAAKGADDIVVYAGEESAAKIAEWVSQQFG